LKSIELFGVKDLIHLVYGFILIEVNMAVVLSVFTIPFRNYQKAMEWDDEMVRSGKYKKYNKCK
jgi:hypothetical protein